MAQVETLPSGVKFNVLLTNIKHCSELNENQVIKQDFPQLPTPLMKLQYTITVDALQIWHGPTVRGISYVLAVRYGAKTLGYTFMEELLSKTTATYDFVLPRKGLALRFLLR